ncbi:MAG: GntR family transcriptional regulator [Deferrisomatales bacterium]
MNDHIYEELKKRIVLLQYPPGHSLQEKDLAREFGVSRTPVRKALMRLEWDKLVTILPRAGVVVAGIDFKKLMEVYHVRISVEGMIGRLAAVHITREQLARLRELAIRLQGLKESGSIEELILIDLEFHDIIFAASNNKILEDVGSYLFCNTIRLWYWSFDKSNLEELVDDEVEEINATAAVLEKGDPDEAEQYRRGIIVHTINKLNRHLLQKVGAAEGQGVAGAR